MNRRLLPAISSSINSNSMMNINRMTLLMSISEITPQVFISGQMAATLEEVQKLGITYILNVAVESSPIVYPKSIKLEKYDIIDFPTAPISNYFNSLTDKMHAHLNANKQHKVLVHCMAGISRSTTIVCAYLMRYMNMALRDAYMLCKSKRPICFPNLGFWNQLIAYENQLRQENSVKMVPTQFGNVPDVAWEELKQMRAQQQQQIGSISSPVSSLSSTNNNNNNNNAQHASTTDVLPSPTRPTGRDATIAHANNLVRSRSLAANSTARPSVAASSIHASNSSQQTLLFTTNKPSFLTPTRFGVGRLATNNLSINNSNPTGPSSSSTSYTSNRSLPVNSTSSNVKNRYSNAHNHHSHYPPTVTINAPATTATSTPATNNDQQRSIYETTYRASFFKPLAP